MSNKQIARVLGLEVSTIKNQVHNIIARKRRRSFATTWRPRSEASLSYRRHRALEQGMVGRGQAALPVAQGLGGKGVLR